MDAQKNDPIDEIDFSKGIVGFAIKSLNKYQEKLKKLKNTVPNKI